MQKISTAGKLPKLTDMTWDRYASWALDQFSVLDKTILEKKELTLESLKSELKSSPDLKANLGHFCLKRIVLIKTLDRKKHG